MKKPKPIKVKFIEIGGKLCLPIPKDYVKYLNLKQGQILYWDVNLAKREAYLKKETGDKMVTCSTKEFLKRLKKW